MTKMMSKIWIIRDPVKEIVKMSKNKTLKKKIVDKMSQKNMNFHIERGCWMPNSKVEMLFLLINTNYLWNPAQQQLPQGWLCCRLGLNAFSCFVALDRRAVAVSCSYWTLGKIIPSLLPLPFQYLWNQFPALNTLSLKCIEWFLLSCLNIDSSRSFL